MKIAETIEGFLVREILVKDGETRLGHDTSLISSGVLDSVALLRLIEFIEKEFGVTVEDDELLPENFQTINTIRGLVEQKLQRSDGQS